MSAIRFPLAFLLPALLLGACAAQNGGASRDGVPIAERIGLIEPAAPGVAPSSFAPMDPAALGPETGTAVGRRVGELRRPEERRVGKEGVRTGEYRGVPCQKKKKKKP